MDNNTTNNLGRNRLPWSTDVWTRIDQAVHDQCERTKVAAKFIPLYGPVSADQLTIATDTVAWDGQAMFVKEAETTPLIELSVEFTLTPQQVKREAELRTAVTLATRPANLLYQAEHVVLFQGKQVLEAGGKQHPLFKEKKVRAKSGPANEGPATAPKLQSVPVPPSNPKAPGRYGEKTFEAVADACSRLQDGVGRSQARYGPSAPVLPTRPYADTYAPLPTTLILPADRIKPLVTAGFCGVA